MKKSFMLFIVAIVLLISTKNVYAYGFRVADCTQLDQTTKLKSCKLVVTNLSGYSKIDVEFTTVNATIKSVTGNESVEPPWTATRISDTKYSFETIFNSYVPENGNSFVIKSNRT